MSEHERGARPAKLAERFFRERFGKEPENDALYFEEWKGRLSGLGSIGEIPPAMDFESRRVWGKVTGQKLGYMELIGWRGPVFKLVDLVTGEDVIPTSIKPDIDRTMPED